MTAETSDFKPARAVGPIRTHQCLSVDNNGYNNTLHLYSTFTPESSQ